MLEHAATALKVETATPDQILTFYQGQEGSETPGFQVQPFNISVAISTLKVLEAAKQRVAKNSSRVKKLINPSPQKSSRKRKATAHRHNTAAEDSAIALYDSDNGSHPGQQDILDQILKESIEEARATQCQQWSQQSATDNDVNTGNTHRSEGSSEASLVIRQVLQPHDKRVINGMQYMYTPL
jgi:hypothetical protein